MNKVLQVHICQSMPGMFMLSQTDAGYVVTLLTPKGSIRLQQVYWSERGEALAQEHFDREVERDGEQPHGFVGYNSGPCEWFWAEKSADLKHELTDSIRPATHLEKYFMNKQGNRTTEHEPTQEN